MQEVNVELAKAIEHMDGLERWQEKQNGNLEHLIHRFDDLSIRIDGKFDVVNEKIISTKNWLIATLTSSIVVLVVLSANLIIGKR